MSSEGRAKTLRALGDASTQLSALKRPGHVYIKKSSGESTDDLISGALKLIEMAGGSAAGISQLLTKDGLSAPGLCEATQIAETLGVVVTCVEDVVAASA